MILFPRFPCELMFKKDKSTLTTDVGDSSDSADGNWLDDEQWQCKNMAQ